MKWILAAVMCLSFCVAAEARPHLKGKVRGWRHKHRHHTAVVVVTPTCPKCECPKCDCCKDCKCEKDKCKCDKKHKCTPKCDCGKSKKETLLWKKK